MEDALSSGHLDLVGVARPFALVPDLANQMQNSTYQTVQTDHIKTGVAFVDKKAGAILLKTLWENGKAGLSTGRA